MKINVSRYVIKLDFVLDPLWKNGSRAPDLHPSPTFRGGRVERNTDGADTENGEEGDGNFDAIGKPQADSLSNPKSEPSQRRCTGLHVVRQLRVGVQSAAGIVYLQTAGKS